MKREIKQLIRHGCAMMEKSKGTFGEIYEWMFSHGEQIIAEGNDGFRTYSYTYNQTKSGKNTNGQIIVAFKKSMLMAASLPTSVFLNFALKSFPNR
mgnify:CR=1 FL=1